MSIQSLVSEVTPDELELLKEFIKLEFSLEYDSETFKFKGTRGDVTFTVSREQAEDILTSRFWMYVITKEVMDYDEVECFKEQVFEELCIRKFKALDVGEYPEEGMYSQSKHITRIDKLKYLNFSIKFVDSVVDFLKNVNRDTNKNVHVKQLLDARP